MNPYKKTLILTGAVIAAATGTALGHATHHAARATAPTPAATAYGAPAYTITDTPDPHTRCVTDAELEILHTLDGVDPSAMTDAQVNALIASVPRPYTCTDLTDTQWRALLAG